ncbi:sulfotransferase 1B1-like [Glandiceps talaboti]
MADQDELLKSPANLPGQFTRDGVVFPGYVRQDVTDAVRNFECRDDDVFIVTYPKSGTTWAIEIVSLILNNADTEYNVSMAQMARVPILELWMDFVQRAKTFVLPFIRFTDWFIPKSILYYLQIWPKEAEVLASDGIECLNTRPSPRVVKSHLPYRFFPKQAMTKKSRIVYVARNPKDTLVSYYYFHINNWYHGFYDKPWSEFYKMAMKKQLPYGDWFDHVLAWEKQADRDNVCFLKYEDMKKDPRKTIKDLAAFLDKTLSEETVDKILDFCSFENMKKNDSVNMEKFFLIFDTRKAKFMRKGVVGDWQNHFTVAENAEFDELYATKMKDSGLTFEF